MNKLISLWKLILHYLKPPRSLRFTQLGSYTVLMTIGIGLAGMNTGNNLLYIIFGMMLGFITASGVISEICLRDLEIDWIVPPEIYAEKAAYIRLILKNCKEKLPSFGLKVEPLITSEKNLGIEKKISPIQQANFIFLPANSQQYFDIQFVPERRGKYLIKEVKIETRFPFGFFRKYLTRTVDKSFVVYPKIFSINSFHAGQQFNEKSQASPLKGWGETFWGLRNFFEGDNPRHISWKSSAKQSRLMVRETERETEKKVIISMNPIQLWKDLNAQELELTISFTASFVWKKFNEGFAVGLIADDYFLSPSLNAKTLMKILDFLSEFDPAREEKLIDSKIKKQRYKEEQEMINIYSLWISYQSSFRT